MLCFFLWNYKSLILLLKTLSIYTLLYFALWEVFTHLLLSILSVSPPKVKYKFLKIFVVNNHLSRSQMLETPELYRKAESTKMLSYSLFLWNTSEFYQQIRIMPVLAVIDCTGYKRICVQRVENAQYLVLVSAVW